MAKILISII